MAKIPPKLVEQELVSPREDEWWEFCHEQEQRDWSNWDQHSWSWYMEVSIRRDEGWTHVKINPAHKNSTVMWWLREQGAVYKHSQDEFLIKDSDVATMVALKWA